MLELHVEEIQEIQEALHNYRMSDIIRMKTFLMRNGFIYARDRVSMFGLLKLEGFNKAYYIDGDKRIVIGIATISRGSVVNPYRITSEIGEFCYKDNSNMVFRLGENLYSYRHGVSFHEIIVTTL